MISTIVLEALESAGPLLDPNIAAEVQARWRSLTKPPGSLGRLEELVLHYAIVRGTPYPALQRKGLYVFCADHGVATEGVSPYPQSVTREMVRNFLRGGAAINVLCRQYSIEPVIVDMGVRGPMEAGVLNYRLGEGSQNFLKTPAMTIEQCNRALEAGIRLAREASERFDIAGVGEMGIGNTTSAAALVSSITGLEAAETVGAGSGASEAILQRKAQVVRQALNRHRSELVSPFAMLRCLGGFEIAAMTGFLVGAAAERLPVVLDGFIAGAAALVARAFKPDLLDAAIFSHLSHETAHARVLALLGVEPYLDLSMRLGEGTGAALAIGLLESALRLYREMATFEEAGVSGTAGPR